MTARGQEAIRGNRVNWMDNLRTFMIFLVVSCHAGGVYESSGTWASFWIVDDPATNDLTGILFLIMDIFVMPTLFLISGFLAARSVRNNTGWAFLRSKFKRLIVPWAVAVVTLIPLYKVIFLYSRNLPQESWATYFHWSNGTWSQNWLWFLPVLFLFNMLYLLLSKSKISVPHMSLRIAVLGTFLVGFVYCVGMDILSLRGWTHTVFLDFQNERLLIYFMVFLLGARCFQLDVFESQPRGMIPYLIVNAIVFVPITIYIFFLLYPWFRPGDVIVSEIVDRSILWCSYLVSSFCLVYVTIETFRRYQNKQGRVRSELNRNSYYVYIIHVIVLGCLALILRDTAVPSLWKHLTLAVSTFVASNMIVSSCRRAYRLACKWRRLAGRSDQPRRLAVAGFTESRPISRNESGELIV